MTRGRLGSVRTRKTLLRKHLTSNDAVVGRDAPVKVSDVELYENKGKQDNTPRKDN